MSFLVIVVWLQTLFFFPVLLMLQPLIKVINQLVLHAHDLLVPVRH